MTIPVTLDTKILQISPQTRHSESKYTSALKCQKDKEKEKIGNNLKEHSKKGRELYLGCILKEERGKNSPSTHDLPQFNIQLKMHIEI